MIAIEFQGQVVAATNSWYKPQPPKISKKRGAIHGFSRRSRCRMIDLMARLDVTKTRVTFLTLTFSGCPAPDEAKKALKRFTMRIRRKFHQVAAIWRMEFQERGSVHFHLMLFSLPFLPQRLLQSVWEKCTREKRSIVFVTLIRSHRMLLGYISKYIGKLEAPAEGTSLDNAPYQHSPEPLETGRIWGWLNKSALPMAKKLWLLTEDQNLARYIWFGIRGLSRGKSGKRDYHAKLFTSEGEDIYNFLLSQGCVTENRLHYQVEQPEAPRQWFGGQPVLTATSVPLAS